MRTSGGITLARAGILLILAVLPASVLAEGKLAIVFDNSGSMSAPVGGGSGATRIDQAKDAVRQNVPKIGSKAVGLVAFQGDCGVTTLIPVAPNKGSDVISAANGLNPDTLTPLAAAIRTAAAALEPCTGQDKIVVLSDGAESCGGDPVAAADAARTSCRGLTINVIGIGLNSMDAAALGDVAQHGGGSLQVVNSNGGISNALGNAVGGASPTSSPSGPRGPGAGSGAGPHTASGSGGGSHPGPGSGSGAGPGPAAANPVPGASGAPFALPQHSPPQRPANEADQQHTTAALPGYAPTPVPARRAHAAPPAAGPSADPIDPSTIADSLEFGDAKTDSQAEPPPKEPEPEPTVAREPAREPPKPKQPGTAPPEPEVKPVPAM